MDKTFTFKDSELRLTDEFIEIDLKVIPYSDIERIAFKQAVFGVRGELRIKPKQSDETRFYFKPVINRQIQLITAHICKTAGISLHVVKKERSRLPFFLAPMGLVVAAVATFYIIFWDSGNNAQGAGMNGYFEEYGGFYGDSDSRGFNDLNPNDPEPGNDREAAPVELNRQSLGLGDFTERVNAAFAGENSALRFEPELDNDLFINAWMDEHNAIALELDPESGGIINITYSWSGPDGADTQFGAYAAMCAVVSAAANVSAEDAAVFVTSLMDGDGTGSLDGCGFTVYTIADNKLVMVVNLY
ncbi:MAG: hypothetical protein FWE91_07275 [Defluviitaleaceae bacterium]|nr:hypothetical protein [Defluviitaleaceae bacterium]MCL2836544.1 hypothetical protein [Defluviitaleaceae bacterium]